MAQRALLWVAFLLVHVGVALLGFVYPSDPIGDVHLVYLQWATQTANNSSIPGITGPWIYPALALIPIMLAWAMSSVLGYVWAWIVVVTALDALAFFVLVGNARSRGRVAAAWYLLGFIVLLGPVYIYRLDAVSLALALTGGLLLLARPWLASISLTVAAWIKVWPAALLAAAWVAARTRSILLAGALVVTGLTVTVVSAAGGASWLLSFVGGQVGRGLQVEAPVSTPYVWLSAAGVPGASVYFDYDLVTYQVRGPGLEAVIAMMTPVLAISVATLLLIGWVKHREGVGFAALFPHLALGLVSALIVFNKVGSPQYVAWLAAPVLLGVVLQRRRWGIAVALLGAIALLTQLIYPLNYGALVSTVPYAIVLLTARNLLLVVLLVTSVVQLVRLQAPHAHSGARTAVAHAP